MMSTDIRLHEVRCPVCGAASDHVVAQGHDFEYGTTAFEFPFRHCGNCDLVYLSPRPASAELARIYPPEYNPFHFHEIRNPVVRRGREFVQRGKAAAVCRYMKQVPRARVIDVGCGGGALLALLKEEAPPGWRLFGNDMNEALLKRVEDLGFSTIPGRFEEIDTPLRFHMIILNQTIEHLDAPLNVARKAFELLLPGGVLYTETPCTWGLDARLFRRRYWGGYHIPRHWTLFNPVSLKSLLKDCGFTRFHATYLASPSFWIQSFHHLFQERGYPGWWVAFWQFKNPLLLSFFVCMDTLTRSLGIPTSNLRMVSWKPQ